MRVLVLIGAKNKKQFFFLQFEMRGGAVGVVLLMVGVVMWSSRGGASQAADTVHLARGQELQELHVLTAHEV